MGARMRRVRDNPGSPGVEGMTVIGIKDYRKQHGPAIREPTTERDLRAGTGFASRNQKAGRRSVDGHRYSNRTGSLAGRSALTIQPHPSKKPGGPASHVKSSKRISNLPFFHTRRFPLQMVSRLTIRCFAITAFFCESTS